MPMESRTEDEVKTTMTKCPICGETAPEPASLCIPRLIGSAERDKPCDYSREGEARFAEEIGEEKAALLDRMMS